MLRQILDNLVLFSFDQEGLMKQFNEIDINHNQYGKFIIKQSTLKEHFEHIDDSLVCFITEATQRFRKR